MLVELPLHGLKKVTITNLLFRVCADRRNGRPHSLWLQVPRSEESKAEYWNSGYVEHGCPDEDSSKVGHEQGELEQKAKPLVLNALFRIFKSCREGNYKVDELIEENTRSMDQKVCKRQDSNEVDLVKPEFPKIRIWFILEFSY